MEGFGRSSSDCSEDSLWGSPFLEESSTKIVFGSTHHQWLPRQRQDDSFDGQRPRSSEKRSHRSSSFYLSRLLQPPVPRPQARGQMATGYRPISHKQAYRDPSFSNGNSFFHTKFPQTRGMGNLNRSQRCLLSSADQAKISEILAFSHCRRNLSVPSNAFRYGYGSFGVHPGREGVQSDSHFPRPEDQSVLRRLAQQSSSGTGLLPEDDQVVEPSSFSRLCSQLQEVSISPHPEVRVPRGTIRSGPSQGVSNPETTGEDSQSGPVFPNLSVSISETMDVSNRTPTSNNLSGPPQQTQSPFSPMASQPELAEIAVSGNTGSNRRENSGQSEMVVQGRNPSSRSPSPSTQAGDLHLYRCVDSRLGSPLRGSGDSRFLVLQGTKSSYKPTGIEGNNSDLTVSSTLLNEQDRSNSVRQLHSSGLHPQPRRHEGSRQHAGSMEDSNLCRETQNGVTDPAHSGSPQCDGRPSLKKGTDSPHRMESEPSDLSGSLSQNVDPNVGRICHIDKSQAASLLQPFSRPKGSWSRCLKHRLDRKRHVRLSSNETTFRSFKKSKRGTLPSPSHSSGLAEPNLVSGSGGLDSQLANPVATCSVSTETARESPNIRQECPDEKSPRMASRRQSLLKRGFSLSLANRISAPQRKSTRTMYRSRVDGFVTWAESNGVDASSPSIPAIAQFLEYLFVTKGLSPGTIRGYKTALADFFAPEILDIKHDTSLMRLISGFFQEKPTSSIKVLPWDLRLVLDALKKPPFEPMNTVDLKFLTFKTVFLFAFASGRRRSEIHALDFESRKTSRGQNLEYYSFSPVLGFMAKNQKSSHPTSTPIVIPSLKDHLTPEQRDSPDKFLCPIRAIKWYINRTSDMRLGKKRLFVSYMPGKEGDICQATISSWLRNTIQLAYELQSSSSQLPSGSRPHQVRSAAASWALKGGVSIPKLMEACFWHSQDTFTSFYLKDCWSQSKDKFSLGPLVSAGSIVQN